MTARFYTTDWHIHSECSYDSELQVETLLARTEALGIREFGITDHVNFPWMITHLQKAAKLHKKYKRDGFHLGVELSPLPLTKYEYCLAHPIADPIDVFHAATTVDGYDIPLTDEPVPLALQLTLEQLRALGVEYVIAAAHFPTTATCDRRILIDDYQRQQMFLANDPRVDIIGHPWWIYDPRIWDADRRYTGLPWFDDFSAIPTAYHESFAEAVIRNHKCVELNASFFISGQYTDDFRRQYAAYIRMLHDMGVSITMGSDAHSVYNDVQDAMRGYFEPYGFHDEDFARPVFH